MGVRTVVVGVSVDPSRVGPGLAVASAEVDRFAARTVAKSAAVDASFGKDFGKVMRGQLGQLSGDVARFTTQTQGLGSLLGSTFAGGIKIGGATAGLLALGAAGVAVGGGLAIATAAAIPFDAAMHNVATIADLTGNRFAAAEQSVLTLSTTLPQSATQLAKGLYDIESSNFHAADAMHVLDVSAKAASAGLTDTDAATRAITGALNAYGLSAASAGDVSDILFQTVNKGVVTFGDLAGSLGEFVGTAAAAKVPLQDVASAYAAITLSGIPAAQAATDVNQLLTHLIKPTTDLAFLYKRLGYESGASALAQKGLAAVVRDIGKATGGSADQVIRLFGRVEPAKALLALLAAGGRNYQTAIDGIANAQNRTGATQKAFNEQMKSTSAQLGLLKNAAVATAIEIGLKLLPPFNAFLQMARQAGAEALPFLEAAMTRVAPLFQQLFGVIGDIVKVLGELAADAAPVVRVLAEIAGAAVVGPLTAFLQVLHALTSFLARHSEVVAAVGVVYAAKFLPSLAEAAVLANRLIVTPIVLFLNAVLTGADGAAVAVKGLTASMFSLTGVATAGLAVGVFGLVRAMNGLQDAEDAATKSTDAMLARFDATNTKKSQTDVDQLTESYKHGAQIADEYSGVLGGLKLTFSQMFGDQQLGKALEDGKKAGETLDKMAELTANAQQNVAFISTQTGVAADTITKVAALQHIDLTKPVKESASARKQLVDYLADLKTQDAVTARAIASNADLDIDKMKELEDQVKKVVDAATSAFANDTDVLGQFAANTDKAAKAQDSLAKARSRATGGRGSGSGLAQLRDDQRIARDRQSLQDAEQRAAVSHSKSMSSYVSRQQSINRARTRLADDEALINARGKGGGKASASVASAEAKAAAADASANLETLYKKAVASSKRFVADINTAIQRGLDPAVVEKLLVEGPTKAEPALQAILADHSGRMVKMVNESETQIQNLSGFVAEQARIAALAMNAPTDFFTKNLKAAMKIAALEAATGGKITVDALATSLRRSREDVLTIAHKFGIDLGDEVQRAVNKRGPVIVHANGQVDFSPSFGQAPVGKKIVDSVIASITPRRTRGAVPRAEGGEIFGALGRDANLAAVTRGEWVQPKAAVDFYGAGFMEAVRTRSFPKFHDGGMVGRDGGWISSVVSVSGPRIVPVPVPISTRSSTDHSVTYNIDKVVANSPWDLPDAGPRTYSASRGVS